MHIKRKHIEVYLFLDGGCCVGEASRIFWHNLVTKLHRVRTDMPRRRWELYHGEENLITRSDVYVRTPYVCTFATYVHACVQHMAAHLPTILTGRPLRRSSRCNCVNYTTHMIRIAFNYSSICEILSSSPLPSTLSHSRVRNSMVMRDERKGKRHFTDSQIENMFLRDIIYLIRHAFLRAQFYIYRLYIIFLYLIIILYKSCIFIIKLFGRHRKRNTYQSYIENWVIYNVWWFFLKTDMYIYMCVWIEIYVFIVHIVFIIHYLSIYMWRENCKYIFITKSLSYKDRKLTRTLQE